MKKRPVSVTVISVLLVLNALLGLVVFIQLLHLQDTAELNNSFSQAPVIDTTDYLIVFAGIIVFFASAIGLFYRQGWMRFLLIGWVAVSLLHGLLSQHITVYMVVRELMFVGIISIFLFGAKENAWFAGTDETPPLTEK